MAAGWIGCAVLVYVKRSPEFVALAAFFFVVASMQLWEALLWRAQPGGCDSWNMAVSRGAMLTNHAEPLVLAAASACLLPMRPGLAGPLIACIVAYLAMTVPASVDFWRLGVRGCTETDPVRGGLVWKWNYLYHWKGVAQYALFLGVLLLTFAAFYPVCLATLLSVLMAGTYAASIALYSPRKIGSMWCFFAAATPYVLLPVQI